MISAYAELVLFLKIKILEEADADLRLKLMKKNINTEKLEIDCVQTYKRLIELCKQAQKNDDELMYTEAMKPLSIKTWTILNSKANYWSQRAIWMETLTFLSIPTEHAKEKKKWIVFIWMKILF